MPFKAEGHPTVTRIAGVALVIALHVGFVYALISGLAMRAVMQLPEQLFAQVVIPPPTAQPPPVTPNLARPTFPTVVAPLIRIEQSEAAVHSITAYVGPPTPAYTEPSPASAASTPAIAIERTHTIPPYPMSARRLAQQGTVRLSLSVGPDGIVSDASVIASSGTTILDDAAVEWVKSHWRYKPATKDGHAVAVTVHANVIFDLKSA